MNYNIILTISTDTQEAAEDVLQVAKKAVMDVLDYDKEDFIAGIVKPE